MEARMPHMIKIICMAEVENIVVSTQERAGYTLITKSSEFLQRGSQGYDSLLNYKQPRTHSISTLFMRSDSEYPNDWDFGDEAYLASITKL